MMSIDLPMGLGMALAQNEAAMHKFESLTDNEKMAIIEQTHSVRSKAEMRALVKRLCDGDKLKAE
ncbi:MAG: hypothetical protein PUB05_00820 [Firmicutes bacterium]|nr:hypothetical protein [Bacillota bacterium]